MYVPLSAFVAIEILAVNHDVNLPPGTKMLIHAMVGSHAVLTQQGRSIRTWPHHHPRERERDSLHSASLPYEDESVVMFCALLRMDVRQWLTISGSAAPGLLV